MGIDPAPEGGPSTFRPTPAIGVTYHLGTDEEEDVKEILPVHASPNENEKNGGRDARTEQGADERDDVLPYPTPVSVAHGKRRATEMEGREGASSPLRGKKARGT